MDLVSLETSDENEWIKSFITKDKVNKKENLQSGYVILLMNRISTLSATVEDILCGVVVFLQSIYNW